MSIVGCPSSHPHAVGCACKGSSCDGSFIGDHAVGRDDAFLTAGSFTGDHCFAITKGGTVVTAEVTCSSEAHLGIVSIGSPPNGNCDSRVGKTRACSGVTTAQCPLGFEVIACNCWSVWGGCPSSVSKSKSTCTYSSDGKKRAFARCKQGAHCQTPPRCAHVYS